MSLCRVYWRADGTVAAVVHPAPKSRAPGESEADWYARVIEKTEQAADEAARIVTEQGVVGIDETRRLRGLPFHDCDPAELPGRKDRARWRVRGGKVRVEKPDA